MARTRGDVPSSVGMAFKVPSPRQMLEEDVERMVERAFGAMSSKKRRDRAVGRIMSILEDNGENGEE